jgi:hypothetical protein
MNATALLEEFKSLKSEMQSLGEECVKIELYAIAGLSGFYSWFFSNHCMFALLFIPILSVGFGFWRAKILLHRVNYISDYLRTKVEPALGIGYESHFACDPKAPKLYCNMIIFWILLIAATLVVLLSNLKFVSFHFSQCIQ